MYPTSALMTVIAAERLREAQAHEGVRAARHAPPRAAKRSGPVLAGLIARWAAR